MVLLVFVGVLITGRSYTFFLLVWMDQTKEREIEDSPVRKVESQIQPSGERGKMREKFRSDTVYCRCR